MAERRKDDGEPPARPDPAARSRPGTLKHTLALMGTIPEPEGTDAAWEEVERGIRRARAASPSERLAP
jgi:hypothetical protein